MSKKNVNNPKFLEAVEALRSGLYSSVYKASLGLGIHKSSLKRYMLKYYRVLYNNLESVQLKREQLRKQQVKPKQVKVAARIQDASNYHKQQQQFTTNPASDEKFVYTYRKTPEGVIQRFKLVPLPEAAVADVDQHGKRDIIFKNVPIVAKQDVAAIHTNTRGMLMVKTPKSVDMGIGE